MKKKLVLLLSLVLLSIFMLTACGGSKMSSIKDAYKEADYTITLESDQNGCVTFTATKGLSTATVSYYTGSNAKTALAAAKVGADALAALGSKISVKEDAYLCVASDAAALKIFNDNF